MKSKSVKKPLKKIINKVVEQSKKQTEVISKNDPEYCFRRSFNNALKDMFK